MKTAKVLVSVLVGGIPLSACISPRAVRNQVAVQPEVIQSANRFRKEYVLAPGDQIEIVVRRMPEISRSVPIRPDGFISLPLFERVPAAGLTPEELDARLTELFSTRLVKPEVTVIAAQVRAPVVYVTGDVNNPTTIPLANAPTAMQAIASAGGLRRSAAARDVSIIRLSEDGYVRAIPVNAPVGGQPGPYMSLRGALLEADDIVFVPESGRSQVTRFIDDIVSRPLGAFNQALGLYVNFKLIQLLIPD